MKRFLLVFILSLFVNAGFAQIFHIKFNSSRPTDGIDTIWTLKLNQNDSAEVSFTNITYANVAYYDQFLPDNFSISSWTTIFRKETILKVKMPKFLRQANQIKQVQSVTLQVKIIPKKTLELQSSAQITQRSSVSMGSGQWYKISTVAQGIHRLSYSFMVDSLKIPKNKLRFSTFGVFGYGRGTMPTPNSKIWPDFLPQLAVEVIDQNQNDIWEEGDYVLFFGQGLHRFDFTGSDYVYTPNYYSNTKDYLIAFDVSAKFIAPSLPLSGNARPIIDYDHLSVVHLDSINPYNTGRSWFHRKLTRSNPSMRLSFESIGNSSNTQISFQYLAVGNQANSDMVTFSTESRIIGTHSVLMSDNLSQGKLSFNPLQDNINIDISYNASSTNANFFLDYVSLWSKSRAEYRNRPIILRTTEGLNTNELLEFRLQASSGPLKIWNITPEQTETQINPTTNGNLFSFTFRNNKIQEFVVFSDTQALMPIARGPINNQNLRVVTQADYIIIIPEESWRSTAIQFAEFHQKSHGYTTAIATINEVYHEFGYGTKDIMAIRRYLKHFYDKNTIDKLPKFLLLVGDASVDYKNILRRNKDKVPTYQTLSPKNFSDSYCTDDFYALLDTQEDEPELNASLDIAIGRFVSSSLAEFSGIVNKSYQYKSKKSFGEWRTNISIIADDVDDNNDFAFFQQSESIIAQLKAQNPRVFSQKIYLDAFQETLFSGGSRYFDVEKLIKDNFRFGSLLMAYIGHGGYRNWAQERIIDPNDLQLYQNLKNLPFLATATCGFAPFDNPNSSERSMGESLLLQNDGGAIGLLTTCREVYISDQEFFMNKLLLNFLKRNSVTNFPRTFGEIARDTKNDNNLSINAQKNVLLCDPGLPVNIPIYPIKTLSISNGSDSVVSSLSQIEIKGEVQDFSGNKLQDFNGLVVVTIYDKMELRRLNQTKSYPNDYDSFYDYSQRIFKGQATVSKGQFSIKLIVPKDINYAIGKGKIVYYAYSNNSENLIDASGVDTNITIGGSNPNAASDNLPPKVDPYMNSLDFVFGGITNNDPNLICLLADESGINTSSVRFGHSIVGILDQDESKPILLDNYYKSDVDDFTKGQVLYPFFNLKEGLHTLRVRAWDNHNNPAEGYTEFVVMNKDNITLDKLLNYPNPFTDRTSFEFEHNRPNQELEVVIQVATITGRVVKSIYQKIFTDGFRIRDQFHWDGLDNFGDKIGRGVYVYKVSIKDAAGNHTHKFQKLLLLK
ncbi:MAG: type IX secretion system sortase PorU [Chitinophagales bacterium]|nr:type IX secretion system sortase PorU [Chitinophagales bacterium]